MFNLSGRVAVVTGGSSGLGVQFAHALGRQGADVVVIARRVEMLKEVAATIAEKYGVKRNCLPKSQRKRVTQIWFIFWMTAFPA